jgi:integrase
MKLLQVDVKHPQFFRHKSGRCYIEYACFFPATNKLEHFRVSKGFAKLSPDDQDKYAQDLINSITKRLKSGWRPWLDENVRYQDEIEYNAVVKGFGNTKNDKNHLRRWISDFLVFKKSDVVKKTFQDYTSKLRQFTLWLEKNDYDCLLISEITNDIIVKFFNYLIQSRQLDKATIKKYRQVLFSMFDYFITKKIIKENPICNLPGAIKRKDIAARPFFDNHIKIFLKCVSKEDPQLFLASMFQFFLLCRPGQELRLLKIQDLDFDRQSVYINIVTAKKSESRRITMPNVLVEICEAFQLKKFNPDFYVFGNNGEPGKYPRGKNYFNNHFRKFRIALGLPDTYKFYSFKHTGAGKILESGATLAELMNQLGHTRFESTIHYVRRHFGERSEKVINLRPEFLKGLI